MHCERGTLIGWNHCIRDENVTIYLLFQDLPNGANYGSYIMSMASDSRNEFIVNKDSQLAVVCNDYIITSTITYTIIKLTQC